MMSVDMMVLSPWIALVAGVAILIMPRLLNYIVPDFVHVLIDGRIVKSGDRELALQLEDQGYDFDIITDFELGFDQIVIGGKVTEDDGTTRIVGYKMRIGGGSFVMPFIHSNHTPTTEIYTVETLYEKINGRAPAYFQFNFQELTSRSFLVDGTAGDFIDAYLFEMDSPINAFGIFSIERSEAGAPLDFIADG